MADDNPVIDPYEQILGFSMAGGPVAGLEVDAIFKANPGLAHAVDKNKSTLLIDALLKKEQGNEWFIRKITVAALTEQDSLLKKKFKAIHAEVSKEYKKDDKGTDTIENDIQLQAEQKFLQWLSDNPQSAEAKSAGKKVLEYIDRNNQYGQSALGAALNKMPEIAVVLLSVGADPTELDASGNNALHVLAKHKAPKITDQLVALLKPYSKELMEERNDNGLLPAEMLANPAAYALFKREWGFDPKTIATYIQGSVNELTGLCDEYQESGVTKDSYARGMELADRLARLAESGIHLGPRFSDVIDQSYQAQSVLWHHFFDGNRADYALDEYRRRLQVAYNQRADEFVNQAIAGAVGPNAKDAEGKPPLFHAVCRERYDDALTLLKAGASIKDLKDAHKNTINTCLEYGQAGAKRNALYAIFFKDATDQYLEGVERRNEDDKTVDVSRERAAHIAQDIIKKIAYYDNSGFLQSVKEPLKKLLKLGVVPISAETLGCGVRHGNTRIMKELLDMGAINLKDSYQIFVHIDEEARWTFLSAKEQDVYDQRARKILQFMKDEGVRVAENTKEEVTKGELPVDAAIARRDERALKRYIDLGLVFPEGYDRKKNGTLLERAKWIFSRTDEPWGDAEKKILKLIEDSGQKASADIKTGDSVVSVSTGELFSLKPLPTGTRPSDKDGPVPKRPVVLGA